MLKYMTKNYLKNIIKDLPKTPGVYKFYNKLGRIIYIGKASNLKNRVSSYFNSTSLDSARDKHDLKTEKLVSRIANLKYETTNSVLEALILEANLIKRHQPHYNIKQKDDKTFANIYITKEYFPRIFVSRPTDLQTKKLQPNKLKSYGPYLSTEDVREALRILRKIFKFRDCSDNKFKIHQKRNQHCLFYPLNLCSAPCVGKIDKNNYKKDINKVILFLEGKNKKLINKLRKEMAQTSKKQNYELAAKLRNEIFALSHVNDSSLIQNNRLVANNRLPNRIEAYDISNIGKHFAVGSMVVFTNGEIDKNEYRKFKIKSVEGQNDLKMLEEILARRKKHQEWLTPNLIIVDGGKNQLRIVEKIFPKFAIIAVSKDSRHNPSKVIKNRFAKNINLEQKLIFRIDIEAHRFAIKYHRKLRTKNLLK